MSETGASSKGRFKPGKSGNPKGRPRKVVEARSSAFDVVIDRTLTITRNGQPREVTMEEALQHRTYQDAIAGRRMAQREVLKWIRKREAWIAARNATKGTRRIEVKQSPDPMNALDALLILGIATPDDDVAKYGPNDQYRRALLEPWAVQAALDLRRSATPLTGKERAEILRCTRNIASLRWSGVDRA
ncbi:MAG: DUF5681 domain-containing protein [Proteobacteria bacterium]|nr:DUF5681 domain-containing protein [Pseudomonadota bacterium]